MQHYWQQVQKHINSTRIKTFLSWFLMIAVLLQLAQLTWIIVERFIEQPAPIPKVAKPVSQSSQSSSQSNAVNVAQIAQLHIFGEAVKAPVAEKPVEKTEVVVEDAAKTRLNLKLMGVYASDDPQKAAAVVEHNNQQDSYRVGDKLPGGNQIILKKVVPPNKIIFENNGRMESLEMENFALDIGDKATKIGGNTSAKGGRISSQSTRQRTIDKRRDRQVTQKLQEMREQLATQGISSFVDLVRVSPVKDADGSAGFKISPGKDRQLFARMGFQTNDVVKSVNGMTLDISNAGDLMNLMNTAEDLSLVVQRGNSEVLLQFSLSEANQNNSLRKKDAF